MKNHFTKKEHSTKLLKKNKRIATEASDVKSILKEGILKVSVKIPDRKNIVLEVFHGISNSELKQEIKNAIKNIKPK